MERERFQNQESDSEQEPEPQLQPRLAIKQKRSGLLGAGYRVAKDGPSLAHDGAPRSERGHESTTLVTERDAQGNVRSQKTTVRGRTGQSGPHGPGPDGAHVHREDRGYRDSAAHEPEHGRQRRVREGRSAPEEYADPPRPVAGRLSQQLLPYGHEALRGPPMGRHQSWDSSSTESDVSSDSSSGGREELIQVGKHKFQRIPASTPIIVDASGKIKMKKRLVIVRKKK